MAKRYVEVTRVIQVLIDIPDSALTEVALKEFQEVMFKLTEPDEIFRYAASYVALYGEKFVEGIGDVSTETKILENT